MFNEGISKMGDILDLGTNFGILSKNGSFYSYEDTRLGQGREQAKEFLRNNGEVAQELENKIRDITSGAKHQLQEDSNGTISQES